MPVGGYTGGMSRFKGVAHIVAGDASTVRAVQALLVAEGFAMEGDPDVYVRTYTSFGVDDARELAARADSRALVAPHRVFVVVTPSMTAEAQNALLKTLEDAPGGASFFLLVPNPDVLLPTVRSRCVMLTLASDGARAGLIDPRSFLAAAPSERIDMLKPLLDADERDLSGVYALLSDIEHALAPQVSNVAAREGLAAVYRARQYVGDKGALLKPLLEQVAMLVPTDVRASA